MSVTIDELAHAEGRYRFEMELVEASRQERNRLVRVAVAHGWTHSQIAAATQLSRARVGQIALKRN